MKFTRKNDKFKGEIHNNMESDKTIKRISAEFTSDTDGIDLNFFIKPVDWNNYVKPNNKDDSWPKTKKESSVTVTTYDFPASGTKFTVNEDNTGDALFSKDNNTDNVATANGPFKAIGFEAAYYGEGDIPTTATITLKNLKVIDQNDQEIDIPWDSWEVDNEYYDCTGVIEK